MRPTKPAPEDPDDLFRARLSQQIDPRHPLVRLAGLIDWEGFEARFGQLYHLQLEVPIDPSSLVRWRRRIGQDGIELLLQETIAAAQRSEAVKAQSLERVSVDTTVQPKAIAHPLDSRLYHRGREILVRLAKRYGVPLRQSYARLGKKALRLASRYAHARQMKRARREIKRLKTSSAGCSATSGASSKVARRWQDTSPRRWPASSGCWRSSAPTRTKSTPCTRRRWRASPKARRTRSTSSAPRSRSPSPIVRVWWSGCRPTPATRTTARRLSRRSPRSNGSPARRPRAA